MLHEPRKDPKAAPPQAEKKPRRFRLVRLEERITPSGNPNSNHSCYKCGYSHARCIA